MKRTMILTVVSMLLAVLSVGPVSAAGGQQSDGDDKAAAQERKNQRTLAKRNASAKALKAKLDKGKLADKQTAPAADSQTAPR